jgi:hypothetical protein
VIRARSGVWCVLWWRSTCRTSRATRGLPERAGTGASQRRARQAWRLGRIRRASFDVAGVGGTDRCEIVGGDFSPRSVQCGCLCAQVSGARLPGERAIAILRSRREARASTSTVLLVARVITGPLPGVGGHVRPEHAGRPGRFGTH